MVEYELTEVARLINQGFVDYFVPVEFNRPVLLYMVQQDSVDVASSRVVVHAEEPVGIALIARRGWTSRVVAMALVPKARGQGVGTWLMDQLVAEAKTRGEQAMLLEVIEQNNPAVSLYRRCGFQVQRRLVGFAGTQGEDASTEGLAAVDIREVARLVTRFGLPNLPWQISGETLAQLGFPNRAYRLEGAYAVISDPEAEQITLRSVLVRPEARRQGQAVRLLQALMANFPHKQQWRVPVLCPEEMGGVFEKIGFERETLTQLQMKLDL
jgi:ribosomal protein S18 acetylase RimI-like enzyme